MLQVLVIYNDSEHLIKGRPQDIVADRGVVHCAQAVAQALQSAGCVVEIAPITGDVEILLAHYSPRDWLVFNLGEGLGGRLFEEVRIAWVLEAMGYRFTGSDAVALALSTHKARAKAVLRDQSLPTPLWRLFPSPDDITDSSLKGLDFPLFVKPVAEDSSLGIDVGSVVRSPESLRARVALIVEYYHQSALVETFVDGREVYASLWGSAPIVLPLAEVDFQTQYGQGARVVSFASKWQPESVDWASTPVTCPALVDSALDVQLRELALASWRAIGGRGYGRVDMRIDKQGAPWIIEVNCNPDLSPDGGFFTMAKAGGCTYSQMVTSILQFAMEGTHGYYRPRHTG
jgi:D-alanine-D-alanine ligase